VAGFIGSPAMNLIPATLHGEVAEIGGQGIALTPAQRNALTSANLVVGIRPEGWEIKSAGTGISATVEVVEELGSDQFLYCTANTKMVAADETADQQEAPHAITVRAAGMSAWQRGEKIGLVPQPGAVHLFDAETGERLPD
jgi:multiple sugar transport system ATP-binding protein